MFFFIILGSPINSKNFPNNNSDDRRISYISSENTQNITDAKSNNTSKKNSTKEFLTQRQRTLLIRLVFFFLIFDIIKLIKFKILE